MKKTLLTISLLLLILTLVYTFVLRSNRETILLKQSNDVIEKVDDFKSKKGHLPLSLEDIGIKETVEGPIFYTRLDSLNYAVYFGTSLGESKIYYSDSKKWENRLR